MACLYDPSEEQPLRHSPLPERPWSTESDGFVPKRSFSTNYEAKVRELFAEQFEFVQDACAENEKIALRVLETQRGNTMRTLGKALNACEEFAFQIINAQRMALVGWAQEQMSELAAENQRLREALDTVNGMCNIDVLGLGNDDMKRPPPSFLHPEYTAFAGAREELSSQGSQFAPGCFPLSPPPAFDVPSPYGSDTKPLVLSQEAAMAGDLSRQTEMVGVDREPDTKRYGTLCEARGDASSKLLLSDDTGGAAKSTGFATRSTVASASPA